MNFTVTAANGATVEIHRCADNAKRGPNFNESLNRGLIALYTDEDCSDVPDRGDQALVTITTPGAPGQILTLVRWEALPPRWREAAEVLH